MRRISTARRRIRRAPAAASLALSSLTPTEDDGIAASLRSMVARIFPTPSLEVAALQLSLQGKMLLDRVATGLRWPLERVPSEAAWKRTARELRDARRHHGAAEWKDRPETYHGNPPKLVPTERRSVWSSGIKCTRLTFDSGYRPPPIEPGADRWLSYHNNRTAHAWVLRHPGPPRPWLICIHGYGCGTRSLDFAAFRVAWLYKTLGLNVALPVLPLHGPRAFGWRSGEGFFGGDILDTLHAEAQAVWDVRRLLSWIRDRGAPAVGLYGLSLGGYTAAVVAGLERDLSCVIAGIPATDFIRLAQMHHTRSVLDLAARSGLDWDELTRLYEVISPLKLKPLVPVARRFIFAGRGDCIVPPEHVQDLWEHWKRPQINWYDGSHLSFYWESSVAAFVHQALRATLLEDANGASSPEDLPEARSAD